MNANIQLFLQMFGIGNNKKQDGFLGLNQLLQQMKKNGLENTVANACLKDLLIISKKVNQQTKKMEQNSIRQYKLQQIKNWKKLNCQKLIRLNDYSYQTNDPFKIQILVNIMIGVWLAFDKKTPHNTQMISLWMLIHSNKKILQIKTGEGKSMIVAMLALFHTLRDKKVDVFTSNEVLAQTQTTQNSSSRKLFQLFDITVGDNCDITEQNKIKTYNNQVIYGTSFSFQADYLYKIFYGKTQYFKDRNFDKNHVAILDQVDALLIDRMRESTRIASPKPLFESIKFLFVLINEIKKQLQLANKKYQRPYTVKILNQTIQSVEFYKIEDMTPQSYIANQKKQILQIIKNAFLQNKSNTQSVKLKEQTKQNLKKLHHYFPYYLIKQGGYISKMLQIWIDSCYQIHQYQQNIHFIINKEKQSIIPIDISTGTFQYNTKWSNGIHQFIQLKHGFQPSMDSIVSNYESNLIFFQRYKQYLYGLTGTIARQKQINQIYFKQSAFQKFLKDIYSVKIYKIPTAKTRRLQRKSPLIYTNQKEWLIGINEQSKMYSQNRLVLIIFNTIKEAQNFIDQFPDKKNFLIKSLYNHDTYLKDLKQMQSQKKKVKTIIVSTNLGGRGTDIKIDDQQILKNGGLHVMMTYFPANWRIQQQAFGRAGRNGQQGSGCFYLNIQKYIGDNKKSSILQKIIKQQSKDIFQKMNQKRKQFQYQILEKSKIPIENQLKKKILLDQFYQKYAKKSLEILTNYQKIRENRQLTSQQIIKRELQKLQLQCVQQQWGIFLNQNLNKGLGEQQSIININFEEFQKTYKQNYDKNDLNPGLFAKSGVKLLLVDKKEEAQKIFKRGLIKNQNNWVIKYYQSYLYIKDKENTVISQSIVNQIDDKFRQIANQMMIQLCIKIALASSSKSKDKQLNVKQVQILTSQLQNLYHIAQTLKKSVIQQQKLIGIRVQQLKAINQQSLNNKGFFFGFRLKIFINDPQRKNESFFQSFFSGIGNLFLSVINAVGGALYSIGGLLLQGTNYLLQSLGIKCQQLQNIWKICQLNAEKCFNNTKQAWDKFVTRIPQILLVGLGAVSFFIGISSGFLSPLFAASTVPVMLSLANWIYFKYYKVEYVQLQQTSRVKQKLKLVQITGLQKLEQISRKKIQQLQKTQEQKKNKLLENYDVYYRYLDEYKKGDKTKIKKVQQFVLDNSIKQYKSNQQNKNKSKTLTHKLSNIQKMRDEFSGESTKINKNSTKLLKQKQSNNKSNTKTKQLNQLDNFQIKSQIKRNKSTKNQPKYFNKQMQNKLIQQKKINNTTKQQIKIINKKQDKISNQLDQILQQEKIKEQKRLAMTIKTLGKTMTHQKLQNRMKQLKQSETKNIKLIQESFKSSMNVLNQTLKHNINAQIQVNKTQSQINSILQKSKQDIKTRQKYIKNFGNIFKQQNCQFKKQNIRRPSQNVQFNFIDKKSLQSIQNKTLYYYQNLIQGKKSQQQISKIQPKTLLDPVNINEQSYFDKQTREILIELKDKHCDTLYQQLHSQKIKDLQTLQSLNKKEQIHLFQNQYQNNQQKKEQIENIKNNPFRNYFAMNKYIYYKEVIEQKSNFFNFTFKQYNDTKQFDIRILTRKYPPIKIQNQKVFIIKRTILILQNQDRTICKVYQKQSQEIKKFMQQMRTILHGQKLHIQYAKQNGIKFPGFFIIRDYNYFVERIDQMDQKIWNQQIVPKENKIKQQFTKTKILRTTKVLYERKQYNEIYKKRQFNIKKSLPLMFFPFELKLDSQEFQKHKRQLIETLCQTFLHQLKQIKEQKNLVQKIYQQILYNQIIIIKEDFQQHAHLVQRKNRRRI